MTSMHWFSILTALTYALILAFLVVIKGWEFQEAAITVLSLALGVMALIVLALISLSNESRKTVWQSFIAALKRDLCELLDALKIRKCARKENRDAN